MADESTANAEISDEPNDYKETDHQRLCPQIVEPELLLDLLCLLLECVCLQTTRISKWHLLSVCIWLLYAHYQIQVTKWHHGYGYSYDYGYNHGYAHVFRRITQEFSVKTCWNDMKKRTHLESRPIMNAIPCIFPIASFSEDCNRDIFVRFCEPPSAEGVPDPPALLPSLPGSPSALLVEAPERQQTFEIQRMRCCTMGVATAAAHILSWACT